MILAIGATGLSARLSNRVLKLAYMFNDLEGSEEIQSEYLAQVLNFRLSEVDDGVKKRILGCLLLEHVLNRQGFIALL